jgi:hypothetical protein
MSLVFNEVRKLSLAPGSHPRGLAFLSAASGLVRVRDRHYVVADDEHHLGTFRVGSAEPLRLIRLFEGDLPASARKRKSLKPDFESLLVLPASNASPHGSLLALGSGSRPNRCAGALLDLDDRGEPRGATRLVDLEPLYADLSGRFDELNIEGAFVAAGSLVLLQRGGRAGASAAIRYALADVMAWLAGEGPGVLQPRSVRGVDLGAASGVAFAFTDGAALDDGSWVFSAVAEDRDGSYDDGPCVAAAVGVCSGDDVLVSLETIAPRRKIEGIEARVSGAVALLSLVTDADDPGQPAALGTTSIGLRGALPDR